ncbi:hypothetical protein NIES4074_64790 (plasmid) [Cylindrospermum sp. NIES-4074]|nr:hypothetical protein NIES4074_64790 [Cylindrospermum sp. NIES-4074]
MIYGKVIDGRAFHKKYDTDATAQTSATSQFLNFEF